MVPTDFERVNNSDRKKTFFFLSFDKKKKCFDASFVAVCATSWLVAHYLLIETEKHDGSRFSAACYQLFTFCHSFLITFWHIKLCKFNRTPARVTYNRFHGLSWSVNNTSIKINYNGLFVTGNHSWVSHLLAIPLSEIRFISFFWVLNESFVNNIGKLSSVVK